MLDAEAHLDLLSEALISGSPGVSKEAREVLRRRRVWIDRSRLEGDLARGGPVHGRKNVLRVLAELSRFDALPSLLLGAGDPEEEVRAVAVKLLKRWIFDYNRCHVRPTPEQLSRARKALEEARERLPSELYRELFYYTGQTD